MIYNTFWFPWKVPSLNELNEFRAIQAPARSSIIMRRSPKKKKGNYTFNLYNKVKQEWSKKVCNSVKKSGFKQIDSCYFNYLVVEKTLKRDPSNICASAIKFIEDGLIQAGVIPNDSWANVLGINPQWVLHRKTEKPGVLVVMSEKIISFEVLCIMYLEKYDNRHPLDFVNEKSGIREIHSYV